MTLFNLTHGLHREDQPTASAAAGTHVGQAHFAGSGPMGRTCRECVNWVWSSKVDGWSKFDGPRPARCAKYKGLMREWGRKVPHGAYSCKYFELRDSEVPLVKPEKAS